jgi:hypothetical protein
MAPISNKFYIGEAPSAGYDLTWLSGSPRVYLSSLFESHVANTAILLITCYDLTWLSGSPCVYLSSLFESRGQHDDFLITGYDLAWLSGSPWCC